MKIWIENYNQAKLFVPSEPTIAVRVFDPDARPYKLASARWSDYPEDAWDNCPEAPFNRDAYNTVLEYTFADQNPEHPELSPELRAKISAHPNLFTEEIADAFLQRFKEHYKDVNAALFHCNAGASRSVAMARAAIKVFNITPEFQGRAQRLLKENLRNYVGNHTVYNVICRAASKL